MNLSQKRIGDFVILRVDENRVDVTNSSPLNDLLQNLVEQGDTKVVVDLSAVSFMDSCGLAGLFPSSGTLPGDGCVILAGLSPRVRQLFKLTRLDTIFAIYPSVNEALLGQ